MIENRPGRNAAVIAGQASDHRQLALNREASRRFFEGLLAAEVDDEIRTTTFRQAFHLGAPLGKGAVIDAVADPEMLEVSDLLVAAAGCENAGAGGAGELCREHRDSAAALDEHDVAGVKRPAAEGRGPA